MRVCFINFDGAPTIKAAVNNRIGGLNTILFNLLKSVSLLPEIKTSVVYRDDGLSGLQEEIPGSVKAILAGKQEVLSRSDLEEAIPLFVQGVKGFLLNEQQDVIHTSGSEAGIAMCQLRQEGITIPWVHTNYATLAVRRVIVEGMSSRDALSDMIGQRELCCLEHCDHIIALSEVDRLEVCQVFGISPGKVSVAWPGIDHNIFYPPRINAGRAPVVVSAGRMSRIKDFPFLLRSFRILDYLNPSLGARLLVIGGNQQERESLGLHNLANSLRVSDKVAYLDGTDQGELAEHFRSAKVFAGVSKHETFGLLPVEARACGTPFVVRSNSSYLATATDGYGGFFSGNGSEEDMARKLNVVLSLSEGDWQVMSKAAYRSAQKFEWAQTAKACHEAYCQLARRQT